MPRGDGTGPMGMGSMTGRAAGYCAGFPSPGFMNPIGGRLGLGRGGGRGFRAYPRYGLGRFPGLSYPSYYGSPAFAGYGMPYGGGYGMPYGGGYEMPYGGGYGMPYGGFAQPYGYPT